MNDLRDESVMDGAGQQDVEEKMLSAAEIATRRAADANEDGEGPWKEPPPPTVTVPESEWQTLQEQARQATTDQERVLRLQAEFENARKRASREREETVARATGQLIEEMLPVLDNFERALQSAMEMNDTTPFVDGVRMVYDHLTKTLQQAGLERVPSVGEPFDPERHEAIAKVESDEHDNDTVIEEIQAGYLLNDRLLRPALVKVATAIDHPTGDAGSTDGEEVESL